VGLENEGVPLSRMSRLSRTLFTGVIVGSLVLLGGSALATQDSPPPEGGDEKVAPSSPPPSEPAEPIEPDQGTEPGGDDVGEPVVGSAALSATPVTGPAPLTVSFDPSGSTGVSAYRLDFGDGQSTEGKGPPAPVSHTYATPAAYTATLTVISNRDTFTDAVTIEVTEETPDEASPSPTEEEGAAPGPGDPDDPSDAGGDTPLEVLDADAAGAELPNAGTERSLTVSSVRDPTELSFDPQLIAEGVLLTALLILLIGFPAEMFNATLLENYDEISGWFSWSWLNRLRAWIASLHGAVVAIVFAAVGALIHANLEPHFAFDRGSLALLVGLFTTFLAISLTYDVMRGKHLRRRHDVSSRLRAQAIGMVVAVIMVFFSRIGHFHPGYMYGLFTALIYGAELHERHHGRALAFASIRIGLVAVVGWFLWIPVKHLAEEPDASFLILTLDAMLAVLWVASLAFIVFGLAPLKFFYGATVKKWSLWGWLAIYVPGVFMFVYTLLHPERGLYGSSEEASLFSVLLLFICFGVFSIAFWGFFRVRALRRRPAAGAT
jgi:hypothetical protein